MDTICITPGCNNIARKNKKGHDLLHCSRSCQNKHNSIKGKEKRKETCLKRFGETTNLKSKETKDKIKQTNLDRYSVEHPAQNNAIKQKMYNTKLNRYGDIYYNNREKCNITMKSKSLDELNEIKETRKITNLKKYGFEYTWQNEEVKNKIKQTNLEKYGFENPAQSIPIIEKIKHTMNNRYGGHFNQQHISKETLEKLNNKKWLTENTHRTLKGMGMELTVAYGTIKYAYDKNDIYHSGTDAKIFSIPEQLLAEHIKTKYNTEVITNDRTLIKPKEIDIYLPEYNLAIEYNGVYWHRPEVYGSKQEWSKYHQNKIDLCNQKGIQLLHLWENYGNHKDLVEIAVNGNIINDLTEIYENIYKKAK